MIIAANFKTNHTRKSTREYVETLKEFLASKEIKDQILIFPPATALDSFSSPSNLKIGAQNAYPVVNGSFTGEIGLEQLDEFGIKTILLGHSERRHILKESQELIAKKFSFFKERDFEIVYCVGEPLEIREKGFEALVKYIYGQLENIDLNYDKLIVAYEPVWAIGTGLSAKSEDIKEVLNELRKDIKAPLLYGGSVKPSNAKEILSIQNCDGLLIGTASWKAESFCEIIEISKKLAEEK